MKRIWLIMGLGILISCSTREPFLRIPVAHVPVGFPVNFALHTFGDDQFVAFYDTSHQMTVGKRKLPSSQWEFKRLPSTVGWDSHNYISMAIDRDSLIHVVGNLHSSPMIYFRSEEPLDIQSMQAVHQMTGQQEDVATYPEFIQSDDRLVFHYRYGRSGNGYEVYNIWNPSAQKWERLLDTPLIDGEGKMNAYMQGPTLGPDGYFHLLWVWRDTPDCATNHDLSYARSKDLITWETIDGTPLELPIRYADSSTYIDPTPVYGGLINIGIKIGFDQNDEFIAGYHKYDSAGNTQLHLAKFENSKWKRQQLTNWEYRWDFKGFGTIENELLIESPNAISDSELIFGYHHQEFGDQQLVLDAKTWKTLKVEPLKSEYQGELGKLTGLEADKQVNIILDQGYSEGGQYLLRWETKKPNRDQKPDSTNAKSTLLELIKY